MIWEIFRYLIEVNGLLIFMGILVWVFMMVSLKVHLSYRMLLKLSYVFLIASLVMPLIHFEGPAEEFIKPLVTEYAGLKRADFSKSETGRSVIQLIDVIPKVSEKIQFSSYKIDQLFFALSLIGFIVFLLRITWSHIQIRRLLRESFLYRKFKTVTVLVNDEIQGPFSYRTPYTKYILIPNSMLGEEKNFKMSLAHETQHHRQSDTAMIYILEFLQGCFFYNPFMWLLHSQINKCSELACDEALLGQQGFSLKSYSLCLIEVAEKHGRYRRWDAGYGRLVGTANLSISAKFLKRRINAMEEGMSTNKKKGTALLLTLLSVFVFSSVSYASKALTKSHRLSMGEARRLAKVAERSSGIPIYVDRQVLKYLNLGLGTERGRRYIKSTLKRMNTYKGMISTRLAQWNLPEDLLAVPAHESGFQNYDNGIAAGIWSITPRTARVYGVQVDDQTDDRFDAEKLTLAAVKYYSHLIGRKEFKGNWHLALLSYNAGERRVINAINEVGSYDVRVLAKKAKNLKPENRAYVPRLMAWLIVLNNPDLIH